MVDQKALDPRATQRERLVICAEQVIATQGLSALRARDLALCVGCSVGAIYNLVEDLDEIVLRVAQRTMADLNAHLEAVASDDATMDDEALFVAWALAYGDFAAANRNRWQALFEFRLPTEVDLPPWFAADQTRLFIRLEKRLQRLLPDLDAAILKTKARTLFSAVHGIVSLGLDGKLVALPPSALEAELAAFVRTYVAGLRQNRDRC